MDNAISALEATVHRVLERLARDLAGLGLSAGEVNALARLDAPLTVAQLQAATGQRASTLTGTLDRLERQGLVERIANPRDRRSFLITITNRGAKAAAQVQRAFDELEREALGDVSKRSVRGFFEVLAALDRVAQ
jgi:MarR family transcriptional regulator, organic hydroperoxide resistance regulator